MLCAVVRFLRTALSVYQTHVCEFGIGEPEGFVGAGLLDHAAGTEARDQLRGDRCGGCSGPADGCGEHEVELFFADADEAPVLQVVDRFHIFGYEAYIEDHADVDGRCYEVVSAAVVREGVLVGVASGVVALTAGASDAGAGGEHDEEVEFLGRTEMEIPAPLYFRADGGCEAVAGHVLKCGILEMS